MDHYVGLDVSLAETSICVIDQKGSIVHEAKVPSDPVSLGTYLTGLSVKLVLIGVEAGQLSSWLFHGLDADGLPVVCIESHHMSAALSAQRVKTDKNDARGIAQMMRMGWYRKVHVKSPANQRYRVLLNNRRWLLERRVDLTNQIRGNIRTFGYKLGSVGIQEFEGRVRTLLADDRQLLSFIEPMLRARAVLLEESDEMERQIRRIVRDSQVCRRLMTIPGIGPLNALAFVTAIDNPHVFRHSRDVGAYLGLTPSKYASGEVDRTGAITKAGDGMVRAYLFEAAHVLMTRLRRPHRLRTWAGRIAKRSSSRTARVALARRLAVIMHRMWVDGTTFRWDDGRTATAQ